MESEPGKGSTFWFTAALGKRPASEEEPVGEPIESIAGKRVLVVDDNATNRLLLSRLLESWRCRREEASDAKAALEKLRAGVAAGDPFDVAILDMQMPEMDGETLGRIIKEDAALRKTLLMMMTSVGRRGDARRLEEIGFSAYLTKPVKQSQLYDCLTSVINRRGRAELRATPIITRHAVAEDKRRRVRILIAEDDATNQMVALKTLEKLGYRATAVDNGLEALKALESASYDLVFMDVQMPEMDGFEATKRIRDAGSRVQNHDVPIIAMTAQALKGDRERCLAAGMDDYVSKPIQPRELVAAIERQLARAAADAQPAPARGPCVPAGVAAGKATFERAALLERTDNDEDLARTVLEVYMEDAPKQIRALREAMEAKDAAEIRGRAHKFKGASGSVGALALQEAAYQAEMAAQAGDVAAAAALLPEIEEGFERLKQAVASLLKATDCGDAGAES